MLHLCFSSLFLSLSYAAAAASSPTPSFKRQAAASPPPVCGGGEVRKRRKKEQRYKKEDLENALTDTHIFADNALRPRPFLPLMGRVGFHLPTSPAFRWKDR